MADPDSGDLSDSRDSYLRRGDDRLHRHRRGRAGRCELARGAERRRLRLRARDPAGLDRPAGSGAGRRKKLNIRRYAGTNGLASSEAGLFSFLANILMWMKSVSRITLNFLVH